MSCRLLWLAALLLLCAPPAPPAAPMSFDGPRGRGRAAGGGAEGLAPGRAGRAHPRRERALHLASDGRLREERYRLVWINSALAVRAYADLRVPWDSDRQTLAVQALRVWRDGRWIDHRPTAVVETTPFASAPRLTTPASARRCCCTTGSRCRAVLECDYVLEDKGGPTGPDSTGGGSFAQGDPALE